MENGLRLLGVPARIIAGTTFELPPGQATYLAAVLALRGAWVARGELVALIWPEVEEQRARHNLAQLLYAMRRARWGSGLETETQRVRWAVPTDVTTFRSAAAEGEWSTAAAQYRGDLLEAVPEPTSALLAEWLRHERDELRETWRMALLQRAEQLAQLNDWFTCAQLLRRLLASDGLLEEAVYALMRAEALGGRRDAALRGYGDFRQRLHDELGLEPLETTAELAAAIRTGSLPLAADPGAGSGGEEPATSEEGQADVRPGPVRGLGDDAGPFVGRALELAELHGLMRSRSNRLITLHGPGGTGKTRIARQLARERAGHFADGAAWVRMAPASNESDAVEAVAATLGLRIDGDSVALAAALSDRELLLVLDQVEHLGAIAGLVQALLDGTANVSLLATSRAPLELPDETLMRLRGLAVPPTDDSDDAEAYDAIGLLLRAGRRSRADLQPRGPERTALVALARLLDGSPLALVLAAGWLRFLEPSEILQEVRKDLDVLRSQEPDADRAHASLGAVFESSWTLLSETERESLRRLAVFRGGCTKESAIAVADVPLATLLALTNRSLLYREDNARFAMHSVVQYYAERKLAAKPPLSNELWARHRAYYLAMADDAGRQLDTPEQPLAFAKLVAAGPNLTAALERVIDSGDRQRALELVAALGRFWLWRGRIQEGLTWIQRLPASHGEATASATAAIRVRLLEGLMLERIGRYDDADEAFKDALGKAEAIGDVALMTTARRDLSIVAWRRGYLEEARELLVDVCESFRQLGSEVDLAGSLANLGNVVRDAGDLGAAHAYFDEALSLVERIGHVWEIANTLNNKAITYSYAGDRLAAVEAYERALELHRSMENKPGMSLTLINLGVEYMDNGELELAEQHYVEALKLCEEIGNTDGVGHLNVNLGILAQWSGDFDEAHEYFSVALKLRRRLGARSLVAQSVLAFFDLAVARGLFERALVLEGAGLTLLQEAGSPLPAPHQVVHDEALAKAWACVPAARAAELQSRGAALAATAADEVIDFALGTRAIR